MMQNTQATTDALFSASYVDNYLESAERIPDDIQRQITRIHDIDVQFRGFLRDVDHYQDLLHAASTNEKNPELRKVKRQRSIARMHQALIRAQELSDEKMHLVSQMQELIDGNTRKLETVKDNVDIREEFKQLNAQQMQQQEYADNTSKRSRTSSPSENMLAPSADRMSSKDSGYGSFPGSSVSTISSMESSTQIAVSSLNMLAGESARGNSKRSRRRNDTSDYDAHLAYDCNSAMGSVTLGERGSSGGRPLNISSQKKGVVNVSNAAGGSGGNTGKKKRRANSNRQTNATNHVQANARDDTPPIEAIDPDEPTYCVCNQISFGEMILCDNDLCPIEWFHFSCVSLVLKPKGKWYCPNCRGDRPNIMKPKAQFLRELERYNREKEERT